MDKYAFDEIYFQQTARTTKMMISQENIDAVKNVVIPGFEYDEIEKIGDMHKRLLKRAMQKNCSNEVGMLVNLQDWSDIMIDGTENGITLRENKAAHELLCSAPKDSLLFFHNHPRNSCFSEIDLESFMTSDSILMMSVVCNSGKMYFLIKSDTFDKFAALTYYDTIYENIERGSVKEFLRKCSKVGLKFIYGGK